MLLVSQSITNFSFETPVLQENGASTSEATHYILYTCIFTDVGVQIKRKSSAASSLQNSISLLGRTLGDGISGEKCNMYYESIRNI